jgi:hypothetical protein
MRFIGERSTESIMLTATTIDAHENRGDVMTCTVFQTHLNFG